MTYREQKQTKVHEYDILQRSKSRIESETESVSNGVIPGTLTS